MGLEERPDTVCGKTERQTDLFFFVKLPYSATEPPWHSNCLDCIQTYGQGHRAGHVNVSPHLAFRHHCEILVWIRAGYLELLRETGGGFMIKGAYLSNWSSSIKCCDGRDLEWTCCCSTEPPNHHLSPSPYSLPSPPSSSVSHGSCVQRWRVSEMNHQDICELCYAGCWTWWCYLELKQAVLWLACAN